MNHLYMYVVVCKWTDGFHERTNKGLVIQMKFSELQLCVNICSFIIWELLVKVPFTQLLPAGSFFEKERIAQTLVITGVLERSNKKREKTLVVRLVSSATLR